MPAAYSVEGRIPTRFRAHLRLFDDGRLIEKWTPSAGGTGPANGAICGPARIL